MDYSFQNSERNAWTPGPQQENKRLREVLARGGKTFEDATIVFLYTDEKVAMSEGWHDVYTDAAGWVSAVSDGEA